MGVRRAGWGLHSPQEPPSPAPSGDSSPWPRAWATAGAPELLAARVGWGGRGGIPPAWRGFPAPRTELVPGTPPRERAGPRGQDPRDPPHHRKEAAEGRDAPARGPGEWGGCWGQRGARGAGLTEEEDVLQVLEEGALELLLLLPGQLLGDHAAVTQASPQPAGRGGQEGHGGPGASSPGTSLPTLSMCCGRPAWQVKRFMCVGFGKEP